MRFIVEAANTREILSRDLEVVDPVVVMNLSGPCHIECLVPWRGPGTEAIIFKPWAQIIHIEEKIMGVDKIIASGIVQPDSEVDEAGNLKLVAEGWSSYPNKIPWLQNWNPVVVDPFEIIAKIWAHVQSFPQGNLDVTVSPTTSGTYLLPGFSFDGTDFSIDFFAYFLRAADLRDCGDEMNGFARDIPFDYWEQQVWNANRTQINKTLRLAYPRTGVRQEGMVFVFGDNVLSGKPRQELEIEWASSVIVKGWFPGKMYSSDFTNDDSDRFRRVIKEEDAMINSRERAKVWAKRKLTRRQVPNFWEELTIEPYHPNAPLGQWNLGDEIMVKGYMPWVGQVEEWHRIIGWSLDETGACTLRLKHEGAFNYDPIEFEG